MDPAAPDQTQPANHIAAAAWPGAFGIFKFSQRAVAANLGVFVVIIVANILVAVVSGRISSTIHMDLGAEMLQLAISLVVGSAFNALTTVVALRAAKGKKVNFSQAIERAAQIFPTILLLEFGLVLTLLTGVILLIIPALIFLVFILPRLALTFYFVADEDKKMGPFDAIEASWNATRGNVGKVWGILGVTILFFLPIVTIIGVLLTIYLYVMYSAGYALLYLYLTTRPSGQPATETWSPPALQA